MAPTPQEHVNNNNHDSSFGGERVVISGISGLYPSARNVKDLSTILYDKVSIFIHELWQPGKRPRVVTFVYDRSRH